VLGPRDPAKGRAAAADLGVVHEAMETNLFGAWRTTLAFLPLLRRSRRGRIVNAVCPGWTATDMGGRAAARSPTAPPRWCGV
jgi:NAD(P)-dependent dehydrogenase (short-subunit alcohol dehydrogenase family)